MNKNVEVIIKHKCMCNNTANAKGRGDKLLIRINSSCINISTAYGVPMRSWMMQMFMIIVD